MITELGPRTFRVTREALVAYAAASGDHNPIHHDEDVAVAVGLPGVIAHGMYTLAIAARYVDEAVGATGHITSIGAKFTRPVVVPVEGVDLVMSGTYQDDGTMVLSATCEGVSVLGACKVRVRA